MKLFISLLFLSSCQAATYVHHAESPYSTADDTIIIQGDVVTRHTGYQRKGGPKQYRIKTLDLRDVQITRVDQGIRFGKSIYTKID